MLGVVVAWLSWLTSRFSVPTETGRFAIDQGCLPALSMDNKVLAHCFGSMFEVRIFVGVLFQRRFDWHDVKARCHYECARGDRLVMEIGNN
jgi:hypothetical protein